jgi:Domain of unknown function (DUF4421)
MKRRFLLVVAILICQEMVMAQSPPLDSLQVLTEEGWIQKTDNYASVKLSLSHDVEGFNVETDRDKFEIYPNTAVHLNAGFNYSILAFSLRYAPSSFVDNDDIRERGKTESFRLGLDLVFRHWIQSLSYSRVKGYYLENTADYVPGWTEGDPYIQFPDLRYTSFSGNTGYSFNPKFSVKSLTSQTERQLKSAGTFLPVLHYRYYMIDDGNELVDSLSTRQRSKNLEIVLSAGYQYTFVIKQKFYASLGLAYGIGFVYSKFNVESIAGYDKNEYINTIARLDGRAAIGYNGPRFFTGVSLTLHVSTEEQKAESVINQNVRAAYQLYVGYRFNAPKPLREALRYVMSKNPFKARGKE